MCNQALSCGCTKLQAIVVKSCDKSVQCYSQKGWHHQMQPYTNRWQSSVCLPSSIFISIKQHSAASCHVHVLQCSISPCMPTTQAAQDACQQTKALAAMLGACMPSIVTACRCAWHQIFVRMRRLVVQITEYAYCRLAAVAASDMQAFAVVAMLS